MPHVGIFGTTMCGKSTLVRHLMKNVYRPAGHNIFVFDPIGDKAFDRAGATFRTDDPEEFEYVVKANASQGGVLVVDEVGDVRAGELREFKSFVRRLATQLRHSGYKSHFLGHQYKDVVPQVRNCLQYVFLFRSTKKDCENVADDFTEPELLQGVTLAKGEFIYVEKMETVRRGNIRHLFGKV